MFHTNAPEYLTIEPSFDALTDLMEGDGNLEKRIEIIKKHSKKAKTQIKAEFHKILY